MKRDVYHGTIGGGWFGWYGQAGPGAFPPGSLCVIQIQTVSCPCQTSNDTTSREARLIICLITGGFAPRWVVYERRPLRIIAIPPLRDRAAHRQPTHSDLVPQALHWAREAFAVGSLGAVGAVPSVGVAEGRVEIASEICQRSPVRKGAAQARACSCAAWTTRNGGGRTVTLRPSSDLLSTRKRRWYG